MLKIGRYILENNVILAPMAGVTDAPFRSLCRKLGAGLAVSEMVTSNALLWGSRKTQRRIHSFNEIAPRSVQIAGSDPQMMAEAALFNHQHGAEIIDINMGCPAKKVCKVMAGSALLKDEALVARILEAVVDAVPIPVTLKIRTGWDMDNKNALTIAKIAENAGIQALAIHGRTRACKFMGEAEYDTIKAVKEAVNIPIIANGDISSVEKAKYVLDYTKADAIMIGRAAQGNPWIFKEIIHYLHYGTYLQSISSSEIQAVIFEHMENLYQFYGEYAGVRIARKHLGWYSKGYVNGADFRKVINESQTIQAQMAAVKVFFI